MVWVLGKAPIGTFEFLPVISWQVSILPIADQHFTHCLSAFHPLPISKSAFHPLSISKLSFLQICPNVVNQKLSILPIANQYFTLHQSADQHFTHTLKQMSCQGFRVFDHWVIVVKTLELKSCVFDYIYVYTCWQHWL